jgi:hypothetical protein
MNSTVAILLNFLGLLFVWLCSLGFSWFAFMLSVASGEKPGQIAGVVLGITNLLAPAFGLYFFLVRRRPGAAYLAMASPIILIYTLAWIGPEVAKIYLSFSTGR